MAFGFYLGAAVIAIGGLAEIAFGVRAERKSLESIAEPLTAIEAEQEGERPAAPARRPSTPRERYRPGPSEASASPGMWPSSPAHHVPMEQEVEAIVHALEEHGPTDRTALARLVGARYWGPGRFRGALVEHRIRRIGHGRFDALPH